MSKKNLTIVLIFLLFSFFASLPFLLSQSSILQNDMNGNILQLVYLKEILIKDHSFPLWNPYINQGIPFTSDPLNSYLNPLSLIPFLIFNPDSAVKFIQFFSIFLSCVAMYVLLKFLKVSTLLSMILAMTYASSGFMASRILAGHLEKILTYPLIPFFIYSLLSTLEKPTIFSIGITSIILSLMLFSGDLYTTLYSLTILFATSIFYLFKKGKKASTLLLIGINFVLFSAVKIIPMLELQEFIEKTKEPLEGSQNLISIIYYLFLPIKPIFQIIHIDKFITPAFGWWEKIGFIGIVPLVVFILFVINYKKIKNKHKHFLLLILFVLLLIATPDLAINPYRIIIEKLPTLSYFHVPSRTFAYIIATILLIAGITTSFIIKKYRLKRLIAAIYILNLITAVIFFEALLLARQFPQINSGNMSLINKAREDHSVFYMAHRVARSQAPQYKLLQEDIKTLSSNYGLQIQNSPAKDFTVFDFEGKEYKDIAPKYMIAESISKVPYQKSAHVIAENNGLKLFQFENFTPYATITNGEIKDVKIFNNTIQVTANSSKSGRLQILESYYPGWEVKINETNQILNQNRFLSTNTIVGENTYTFIYKSKSFTQGLVISIISFLLWLSYVVYQNKQHLLKLPHRLSRP